MFAELQATVKTPACPHCHQPLTMQPPASATAAPRLFCAACRLMVELPDSTPPPQALCLYRPLQQPIQSSALFSKLPIELNTPIFNFLSQRELSTSLSVCRAWSKRLQDQELCRALLARDFNMYVRPDEDAVFIYRVVSQNPHHHFALSVQHQLFLKSIGEVWALGNNDLNILGMGKIGTQLPFPHNRGVIDEDGVCKEPSLVKAFAGRRIVQVATGVFHTLFLESTGQVWACGDNDEGQLGFGVRDPYNRRPLSLVTALAGHKIVQVAVGEKYSLFLEDNGQVWGCGKGTWGNLGIGPVERYKSPKEPILIKIFKGHIIRQIVTSAVCLELCATSFFISSKGQVFHSGGLFCGNRTDYARIVPTLKQEKIISVVQGEGHILFLSVDGRVWACGANNEGQLGLGPTENSRAKFPTLIQALVGKRVIQIAVGYSHSLFLTDKGEVWGCGNNRMGQLGLNDLQSRWHPTLLYLLSGLFVKEIAANSSYSLFLMKNDELWGCGNSCHSPNLLGMEHHFHVYPHPIASFKF